MENYNSKTRKGVDMKDCKYSNPKAGQPIEVPSRFLDENHSWRMLTRREKAMLTEGQLYAYEKFWSAVINEEVLLRGSFEKGIAEGETIGEAKANRKNAQNLKNLGVDIDTISKATGLTVEEIEAL